MVMLPMASSPFVTSLFLANQETMNVGLLVLVGVIRRTQIVTRAVSHVLFASPESSLELSSMREWRPKIHANGGGARHHWGVLSKSWSATTMVQMTVYRSEVELQARFHYRGGTMPNATFSEI